MPSRSGGSSSRSTGCRARAASVVDYGLPLSHCADARVASSAACVQLDNWRPSFRRSSQAEAIYERVRAPVRMPCMKAPTPPGLLCFQSLDRLNGQPYAGDVRTCSGHSGPDFALPEGGLDIHRTILSVAERGRNKSGLCHACNPVGRNPLSRASRSDYRTVRSLPRGPSLGGDVLEGTPL